MKISKVEHTRAAVGRKENCDVKGILYSHPGKGEHKLANRIDALDKQAKVLYNILAPIELGKAPEEPEVPGKMATEEEKDKYERKLSNYPIKKANYDRRAKFCGNGKNAVNQINNALSKLIFEKSDKTKPRSMKSNDTIWEQISNEYKIKYSKADIEELITLALRKSIKEAKIKKEVRLRMQEMVQ